MKGIDAAFCARLTRDAETRTTKAGKPRVVLSLAVDEGGDDDAVTWVKALVFEDQAEAVAKLTKGAEVDVEGRLKAEAWSGREGEPRVSLTVLARQVVPMGQIGRRRPPRPAVARAPAPAGDDDGMDWEHGDEVPF